MMAEFLPPERRGRWLVALEGFWAVGTVAVALVAWVTARWAGTDAWRWLFTLTSPPPLIGFWLRLWLPEWPHDLVRSGQVEPARGLLRRVAERIGPWPLDAPLLAARHRPGRARELPAGGLRRRTLLILTMWFLVSTAYCGGFIWLPGRLVIEGHGFVRGYGFLVLLALAQIPGYALAAIGIETLGRRPTLVAFLRASAAGCSAFVVPTEPGWIAAALAVSRIEVETKGRPLGVDPGAAGAPSG
jgi:putative MFS transporter